MQIGIVADDLTGAADSVAPFAAQGYLAQVGWRVRSRWRPTDAAHRAIALTTDTRDSPLLNDALRASLVASAVHRLQAFGTTLYYKKIDSVLRGHLRLELAAMRRALPQRLPIVCSAYPANGRTIQQGRLFVHGVPQERTVAEAFEPASHEGTFSLSLETVRRGVESVAEALDRAQREGAELVCADAVLPADLAILAQAILRSPERYLPVGSAGWTTELAAQLPGGAYAAPPWNAEAFREGRVLVLVGSLHPVSRAQSAYLAAALGVAPVVYDSPSARSIYACRRAIQERFASGQRIALLTTSATPAAEPIAMRWATQSVEAMRRDVALCGLIATGGGTARDIVSGASFEVVGESQAGVAQALLEPRGESGYRTPLLLKSGGFGDEALLARLVSGRI